MKTVKHEKMRKEYRREDLGKGIRGKYFEEYKRLKNVKYVEVEGNHNFTDENDRRNLFKKIETFLNSK